MKKIAVVILHYGSVSTTKACINTLVKHETYSLEIIVVNNDLNELYCDDFGNKKITVINTKKNKGFAGGMNAGIKYARNKKVDAMFLLNNDITFEKPMLKVLADILFSNKQVGIVGPAIKFRKQNKKVYDIGGYLTWFGKTYHKEVFKTKTIESHQVPYITGAAMLIKQNVFEKVGLLDEKYFLYYEDVDFCLRAKKKGFLTMVVPHVFLTHELSKTIGKMSSLAVYHQTRSALIFSRKYMKSNFQKFAHMLFLLVQSILFTVKQPRAGFSTWKAFLAML